MTARVRLFVLVAVCVLGPPGWSEVRAQDASAVRTSTNHKGSLLIFSRITLRWTAAGVLKQDTFIELTNDYPEDVRVQMYFINGDPPLGPMGMEPAHPGWNFVDNEITLTANEPTYWSSATGLPKGVSPFSVLDPGVPPGRPADDGSGDRVVRGFLLAWAINLQGEEIAWNHLTGKAVLVDYPTTSAWEYAPWAFQTHQGDVGFPPDARSGILLLNGGEYDCGFSHLLMNVPAIGAPMGAGPHTATVEEVELTLHPIFADLRAVGFDRPTTRAEFTVWNMNEVKLTGLSRFITCWYQARLSAIGIPNHFLLSNLQTDRAKVQIDGLASLACPNPVLPQSLLGVVAQRIRFGNGAAVEAGVNLVGMGCEESAILYDPSGGEPPTLLGDDTTVLRTESPTRGEAAGAALGQSIAD
jgi:hypothetical protein